MWNIAYERRYRSQQNTTFLGRNRMRCRFCRPIRISNTHAGKKDCLSCHSFCQGKKTADKNQWVHFFIDDVHLRVCGELHKIFVYTQEIQRVIVSNFSLYRSIPLSMQIWNTYRNRALAYWIQRTNAFCFDGIPKNSTVAISTNGWIQDKLDRQYFRQRLRAILDNTLHPKRLWTTCMPGDIFDPYKKQGPAFVHIPHYSITLGERGVK